MKRVNLFKIQIFENDILMKCEGKCPVKEEEKLSSFNLNNQNYKIFI